MQIILYNSSADKIKLDKSNDLSVILTLIGTLRNTCSILTPSVIIDLNDYDNIIESNNIDIIDSTPDDIIYNLQSRLIGANYVYIPDFNRYYYITDITSVKRNLWQISMRVDVLMSFKKYIGDTYAFITRNENRYSDMIKDDMVTYYYDKDITEYTVSDGAKVNYTFNSVVSPIKTTFAITVSNEDSGSSLDTITSPSNVLPQVGGWVTGTTAMSITYSTYNAQISNLVKFILDDANLATFIFSLIAFPFEIPSNNTGSYLTLGTTELKPTILPDPWGQLGVTVYNPTKQLSEHMVIADFTITADSFLDYSPYTTYDMWIPYLGWIGLDADQILNKRLLVVYSVDFKSGSTQVSIIDDTDNKIIFTTTTQLGVKIPITTTNALEVENNRINNNVGLGLGLTASAISIVGGIASYNPMLLMGGVLGATSSVTKFVQNNNTNYSKASGSVGSGNSGTYLPQKVRIRKTSLKPRGYDSNYASLFGKPLNEYYKIGDLSGYTQIGDVHLEGFDNATDGELSQIESLLKSGIII